LNWEENVTTGKRKKVSGERRSKRVRYIKGARGEKKLN